MIVECQKCGYKWLTKSRMITVNCPSCRQSTKNTGVNSEKDNSINND